MIFYRLLTKDEWKELEYKSNNENEKSKWGYSLFSSVDEFSSSPKLKIVKFTYTGQIDEIINYCVKNQDHVESLYPTLEKLGLYYGCNTYNRDPKFILALREALSSGRAVLLEKQIRLGSNYGLLPPSPTILYPISSTNKDDYEYLTAKELAERSLEGKENWIEINVTNFPYQPITIFESGVNNVLYSSKLDRIGHAYIKLPHGINFVDVVFSKETEPRPWYIDMPIQAVGGVRDALQENMNFAYDLIKIRMVNDRAEDYTSPQMILWKFFSNLFSGGDDKDFHEEITRQYKAIFTGIDAFNNPFTLPDFVPPADTVAGGMTHAVSQFLTDFMPVYSKIRYLKPKGGMFSKWGAGVIAGAFADVTAFSPHEERLSNLVEKYPALCNPITNYLKASPDDSNAEGRLKNALEGLGLGAVSSAFIQSLRVLKYARIRFNYSKIRTRRVYNLEAVTQKVDNTANKLATGENKFRATLKGQEYIIDEFKMIDIDYTKRSLEEKTILRSKFDSTVRKDFLKKLTENESYLKEIGFSDIDIQRMKDGKNPKGWEVHHELPLDDGGTNSFDNLVLIKNDPYHKLLTNYQNKNTKQIKVGETIKIEWPMIEGNIYPTKQ